MLCVVEEAGADVNKLSVHWWIVLFIALVVMLLVAVIVIIVCFVARMRRRQQLRVSSGNDLAVVCTLHITALLLTDVN